MRLRIYPDLALCSLSGQPTYLARSFSTSVLIATVLEAMSTLYTPVSGLGAKWLSENESMDGLHFTGSEASLLLWQHYGKHYGPTCSTC